MLQLLYLDNDICSALLCFY